MVVVDIWRWNLSPRETPDMSVLDSAERERVGRFVFDKDRRRYAAGRERMRRILGKYQGRRPQHIEFTYGEFGKPAIEGLNFNMSHTEDEAILCVTQDHVPVGVDIEAIRPIEMNVAKAHFAPIEFAELNALSEVDQCDAFYKIWTRKEAYLKAWGTGLSTDLNSFCVTIGADDPRLLECESGEVEKWSILNVEVPDGLAGALAIRAPGDVVQMLEKGAG